MAVLVALALASGSALAQPAVFWASDPVFPNETAMLVGHQLGQATGVRIRAAPDSGGSNPAEPFQPAEILQAGPATLKFLIPPGIAKGRYDYAVETPSGEVRGTLNAPDIYWAQGDRDREASPGGWLRVFGRNLSLGAAPELRLVGRGPASSQRLQAQSADLWQAGFAIPEGLAPDTYESSLVHAWGETPLGTIRVAPGRPRPAAIFNVKDFGASGNGYSDETAAVKAALLKAGQSGGGTVLFPRGRYLFSDKLDIPRFVTLKGEGRALVQLVWPDVGPPPAALLAGAADFAIEDVTVYASNRGHLIVGGFDQAAAGVPPGRIKVERVTVRSSSYWGHLSAEDAARRAKEENERFKSQGPDALRLRGSDLAVLDCDISAAGRSLFLYEASGARIARNTLTNGRSGWYSIVSSDRVLVEDNLISSGDQMGSGGGVSAQKPSRNSQNIVFRGNAFRSFQGWDREAFTADGPFGFYEGPVKGWEGPRTLLVDPPSDPSDWTDAAVFLVGGTGMGQVALVRAREGGRVLLDRDLAAPPDATTLLAVTRLQRHYLLVANRFQDCGPAIQLFGTGLEHVVADNQVSRCAGLFTIGLWYQQFQPSWYAQFINNTVSEGASFPARAWESHETEGSDASQHRRMPEALLGALAHPKGTALKAPLVLGVVVRRNRLMGNAHIELRGGNPRDYAPLCGGVVEDNNVQDSDFGVRVATGTAGVLVRDNSFLRVNNPVVVLSPPQARC